MLMVLRRRPPRQHTKPHPARRRDPAEDARVGEEPGRGGAPEVVGDRDGQRSWGLGLGLELELGWEWEGEWESKWESKWE